MGLNANQKRAVEYLDGPLLVLAGPGTGKTQLLSSKVAYILENTDTNPENILCLTFTDTGAKNMRERLKTMIGRAALKVNIGTYHAFGSEILAQYRDYSSEYNRRLDTPIDQIIQYKIVREIQSKLSATDILRGDSIKNILGVIGEAKAAELTADDLMKIAEQNIEDSKTINETVAPLLENVVPRKFEPSYNNAYHPIYELLKNYTDLPVILGRIERNIVNMARDLKVAIIEAEADSKIKPLTDWKDKYFEKDEDGRFRLTDRIANLKLKSLANIMKKYEEYLIENGLFDFNDMIIEAGKVLERDDGFRMTLQERYQFIMLDEFQDTNPAQFKLVEELTDYENPMVMAVGDDDQAIYEFQGAKASNLTDFQEHFKAEVIPLVENYRSTQEILDFSREIIRQAPDRFADKELLAHKPAGEKSGIERIEFASSDAECAYIAKRISNLIKSGVRQDEIAVLSYKTKYFEPLLPYLKEYPEIKIAYEKRDNLLEDKYIHEILTIARYVYEVANERQVDTSILEILSYSFFNLPILEIIRLSGEAREARKSVFGYLSACSNSEITEVMAFFGDLVKKSFTEPFNVFLSAVVSRMKAEKMTEYEQFRFYEILASLTGKIEKHFGEKTVYLKDVIEMLDDYEAAGMMLTANTPYRDADEAVQISTAHSAKGLEYEYVFIISADHTAWGKGKGNNDMMKLPDNLMQIRHTGMTDGERLRILYVALTRAKKGLIITNSLADFKGKSSERLEYLEEYVENDEVISPFLPDKKVRLEYEMAAPDVAAKQLKNWIEPYLRDAMGIRSFYRERMANFRMSPSALTSFIDIIYGGPVSFFQSYVLRTPQDLPSEAQAYGTLTHKAFEAITKEKISDEEAVRLFLDELDKSNISTEVRDSLHERGPKDLAISLNAFREILEDGEAEVGFYTDKIIVEGVPVTGIIDHLRINEDEKTIEIYDFKTGRYDKGKWTSKISLYKYALQLEFYKMLLKNSAKYKDYTVLEGHILFVIPDKDTGKVYDKVYEFTEEGEEGLIELMKTIYDKVISLEFMDDPEIFIEANRERGIKDVMGFIELLLAKNVKMD